MGIFYRYKCLKCGERYKKLPEKREVFGKELLGSEAKMNERIICALLIIPAFFYCGFDFKNKKIEKALRIISGAFLILLDWYLSVVLP